MHSGSWQTCDAALYMNKCRGMHDIRKGDCKLGRDKATADLVQTVIARSVE